MTECRVYKVTHTDNSSVLGDSRPIKTKVITTVTVTLDEEWNYLAETAEGWKSLGVSPGKAIGGLFRERNIQDIREL
jgi:hypothetical protein